MGYKGIAGRSKLETISNFEYQMTKTFQIFTQHLRGSSRLEFWILVIRICFGFRISCFEFIENRISKQFSLNQQVISLNDGTLTLEFVAMVQGCINNRRSPIIDKSSGKGL